MNHLYHIMERKAPCSKETVGPVGSMVFPSRRKSAKIMAALDFVFINVTLLSITLPGITAFHILFIIIIPILKLCPSNSEWSS